MLSSHLPAKFAFAVQIQVANLSGRLLYLLLYSVVFIVVFLRADSVSQTLFGNPKGSVELGNPNTCAETKLCLNFIVHVFRLKK